MRPRVIVNVAMSADGKLSTIHRRQVRISGKEDFLRVDRLKAGSDAVLVGIGTVLADDPSLTVKDPLLREQRVATGQDPNPVRIVVDSAGKIPMDADILHKGEGKRVIAVSSQASEECIRALEPYAIVIRAGDQQVDIKKLLEDLGVIGIRQVMVEGGGNIIWSFFAAGLVDELYSYIGNMIIGGQNAPTLAEGTGFTEENSFVRLSLHEMERLDQGVLLHWDVVR
ncbi:MAG: 2,5-diamino-6-(ribosylamino)-4(3H)-pyrimidinone 5'-phosphate reductase [Methanoregulaceae archaeon]|nr:2,5-diamino-6-(ribosylamino)-4(3H)-pyrimidinone 5'-phosphate reductase [Methanoregulaceae archaeon]